MQPQTLDPAVVNLTKAIRQTESGGNFQAKGKSGEYGAYQFTEPTWKNLAGKYLGNPNIPLAQATPQQQNEVAYKQIAEWKSAGKNVGQVASMWNAGAGEPDAYQGTFSNGKPSEGVNSFGVRYSVPEYAKSVATAYQTLKAGGQVAVDPNNPSSTAGQQYSPQPAQQGSPMFPYSPSDNGVTAGLKAIGNTPESALNFGKGALQAVNPINTVNNIGQIGSGFKELAQSEGAGKAIWDIITGLPKATYETLVPSGVRSLISGDTQGAAKAFTEDPFGQAAPIVLTAEGGAKLADTYGGGLSKAAENNATNFGKTGLNVMPQEGVYTQAFNKGVETLAKPATDAVGAISKIPVGATRSVISHLTGLDPQTITAIVSDPASFSRLQLESVSRSSVADSFRDALDNFIAGKEETGSQYNVVRQNSALVAVPENFILDTFQKYGLKLADDGKITADTNSITRNTADINALQKFYGDWGNKPTLTANEFLNMRSDLSELSKFDSAKSSASKTIAQDLRVEANRTIRPQINGLKSLDEEMSPQIELFKKAKKDFLNADGTFKDGAVNKIANAKGLGKENLLSRMEQISPGITKSIQVLKAVEDIERANGLKVGTYTRSLVEGAGFLSGNIPIIIGAILTNPTIAVQILRGFGIVGKAALPVVEALKVLSGDVSAFKNKDGVVDKEALNKFISELKTRSDNAKSAIEARQVQERLPAPSSIQMPEYKGGESGVKSVLAKSGPVGVDVKSGRFKKTYSSNAQ